MDKDMLDIIHLREFLAFLAGVVVGIFIEWLIMR